MINQEALAKAKAVLTELARQYDLHNDPGVSDLYDEQAFPIHMPLGMLRGAKNTLAALNIEALPHVDRAGVMEEAAQYHDHGVEAAQRDLKRSLSVGGDAVFGARLTAQIHAESASAIRALAQPAVNTSPEGVGGWQPIETAPRDGSKFDGWQRDERVTNMYWSDVQDAWCIDGDFGPIEPTPLAISPAVTHWMPPPAPPPMKGKSR